MTLLALTGQLFFDVVHTTSLWVASSGPVAQVAKGTTAYSFLQICSAGGLIKLDKTDGKADDTGRNICPVCASAATSPMMSGEAVHIDFAPHFDTLFPVSLEHQLIARASEQSVFIRGPPLSLRFS